MASDFSDKDNYQKLERLNSLIREIQKGNNLSMKWQFMDFGSKEVQAFLQGLSQNRVVYMIVGGMATVYYGHVRSTINLDLWIKDDQENRSRFVKALEAVKIPDASKYLRVDMIPGWSSISLGKKGFEVTLMGYLKAFNEEEFNEVYKRSIKTKIYGIPINIIGLDDLIKEKIANSRPKDFDDIEKLKRLKNESNFSKHS